MDNSEHDSAAHREILEHYKTDLLTLTMAAPEALALALILQLAAQGKARHDLSEQALQAANALRAILVEMDPRFGAMLDLGIGKHSGLH